MPPPRDDPANYVTVEIYDQTYHLSGQDADHIRMLAEQVDAKMRAVAAQGRTVDSLRVAVLAALNLADDLSQYQQAGAAALGHARASTLRTLLDEVPRRRTQNRFVTITSLRPDCARKSRRSLLTHRAMLSHKTCNSAAHHHTLRNRNRPAKQVGGQRWLNLHSLNRSSTRQSVLCAVSASPECLMNRGELHRLRTGSPAHQPRPSGSAFYFAEHFDPWARMKLSAIEFALDFASPANPSNAAPLPYPSL